MVERKRLALVIPKEEESKPVVCVAEHDWAGEFRNKLAVGDKKDSVDNLLAFRSAVLHEWEFEHKNGDKTMGGWEIEPKVVAERFNRSFLAERGLLEAWTIIFRGNLGKARELVFPDLEEEKIPNLLAEGGVLELVRLDKVAQEKTKSPDPDVVLAVGGDTEAFGRLYETHVDQVHRHIYYRVSSEPDAEDLTSQVFLNAWRSIPRYKYMGKPFQVWLLSIAHNLVVDYYRAHKSQSSLEDVVVPSQDRDDPVLSAERRIVREELGQAVLGLKREQRQAVILRFVDGLEYPDIAAIMGKREGAVRVILHRALSNVRDVYERKNGKPDGALEEQAVVGGRKEEGTSQVYFLKDIARAIGQEGKIYTSQRSVVIRAIRKHGGEFRDRKNGFFLTPEDFSEVCEELKSALTDTRKRRAF